MLWPKSSNPFANPGLFTSAVAFSWLFQTEPPAIRSVAVVVACVQRRSARGVLRTGRTRWRSARAPSASICCACSTAVRGTPCTH